MAVLIINNYTRGEDFPRIQMIVDRLKAMGKSIILIWSYSEIKDKKIPTDVEAVILSGSRTHLQDATHSMEYEAEIALIKNVDVPILGICFGHQLIGTAFESKIESFSSFLSGFFKIRVLEPDEILASWNAGEELTVCQSHQDYVLELPTQFVCLAESQECQIEAMKHKTKPIYGVQAHLERTNRENPDGLRILNNFFSKVVANHARVEHQTASQYDARVKA